MSQPQEMKDDVLMFSNIGLSKAECSSSVPCVFCYWIKELCNFPLNISILNLSVKNGSVIYLRLIEEQFCCTSLWTILYLLHQSVHIWANWLNDLVKYGRISTLVYMGRNGRCIFFLQLRRYTGL